MTAAYALTHASPEPPPPYSALFERRQQFTYDPVGNRQTDGLGNSYFYNNANRLLNYNGETFTYDAKGNILSTTDAAGNTTTFTYNAVGLMTSMADPQGNTTTYTYDHYGNIASVTDPLGHTTTNTYDIMGKLLSMTDANNKTTTYEYDLRGRLKKTTGPDGSITLYEYDVAGNMTAVTDALGNRTANTYTEAIGDVPNLGNLSLSDLLDKGPDIDDLDELTEEPFIIIMAAYPEPRYSVVIHDAYGSVAKRHPHRPDILQVVDALKAQRRMKRVFRPKTVRLFYSCPDIGCEFSVMLPERRQGC